MWRKALWAYAWLWTLGVVIIIGYNTAIDIGNGEFLLAALIFPLLMFVPGIVLIFELRGEKVSIIFTIVGLLITVVPVAGILRFNDMGLATSRRIPLCNCCSH